MNNKIKPFVKWAGGKGSLISQISQYYPLELIEGKIEKYIEPFLGGGAILINILQNYKINEAYAFDINRDLINSYNVIKYKINELIEQLKKIELEYTKLGSDERKIYYNNVRKEYNLYSIKDNELSVKKAVELIFLNRTCFNGLYRVNKNGEFNVPMGNYKNPKICDESNLRALSKLIKNVIFECDDYTKSICYVNEKTFVYFDPPYRPINFTSGFTSYSKEDFNDNNQKELAMFYSMVNMKNCKLMLSNSNPKNTNPKDTFFEDIYSGFNINEIYAKRMINSDLNGRGKISELLITNYDNMVN
jgi:DNA adenine methylase